MRGLSLQGATVLITGASGGLGRALAPELIARGARLALLDLDGEAVTAMAASLGPSAAVHGYPCDVRDLASVTSAVEAAAARFGRLDVVVAAAGIDLLRPFDAIEPEAWERLIDINLNGVWRTFRAALPHVPASGYLMAISSMAAFVHSPLHSAYVSSKAGVWALCDSLRLELRPVGTRVGCVHSTFFASPMTDVTIHGGVTAWGGNAGLLWGMVGLDEVVAGIVHGIERRATRVVVPRRLRPVAAAPGAVRPLLDRIGFRNRDIRAAVRRRVDRSPEESS